MKNKKRSKKILYIIGGALVVMTVALVSSGQFLMGNLSLIKPLPPIVKSPVVIKAGTNPSMPKVGTNTSCLNFTITNNTNQTIVLKNAAIEFKSVDKKIIAAFDKKGFDLLTLFSKYSLIDHYTYRANFSGIKDSWRLNLILSPKTDDDITYAMMAPNSTRSFSFTMDVPLNSDLIGKQVQCTLKPALSEIDDASGKPIALSSTADVPGTVMALQEFVH